VHGILITHRLSCRLPGAPAAIDAALVETMQVTLKNRLALAPLSIYSSGSDGGPSDAGPSTVVPSRLISL
jgi:hypothetical protein